MQGRSYDLTLLENDEDGLLSRQYTGLSLQAQYRAGTRLDFGGNYTISRAWGNVEGETVPNGPIAAGASGREAVLSYPEYRGEWNYPTGDLSIDQRHRARLWLNVTSVGARPDAQRPAGARERRALQRVEPERRVRQRRRSPAVRRRTRVI